MQHRPTAIVLYEQVQSLDVTGPLEVLQGATRYLDFAQLPGTAYNVQTITTEGQPVRTSSGLQITPDGRFDELGSLHTLIIPGGLGTNAAIENGLPAKICALIERTQPERIVSVCSGALVLAATGRLRGRRVATHWADCETLRTRHPELTVEPDALYVQDGPYWTSAGVTAGMDLALALVERDLGRQVALAIARWMVLFLHRPGGQAQFSATLSRQLAAQDGLRAVQAWVVEHPDGDCSHAVLAKRANMSPRHFSRRFRQEVGSTPGQFVQAARVDAARRLLEQESMSLVQIADATGFGSTETMRRSFIECLAIGPAQYRQRFQTKESS